MSPLPFGRDLTLAQSPAPPTTTAAAADIDYCLTIPTAIISSTLATPLRPFFIADLDHCRTVLTAVVSSAPATPLRPFSATAHRIGQSPSPGRITLHRHRRPPAPPYKRRR
ncbi:hypothetical protein Salat_0180700 [Sesamum alatum]|uniref:Uncharacterized protein n=1 Tax=Sesamum alatum TaxID=300844 RepID=A0AAE1YXW2_9LAMI|nr:hypothetical protein Salat_0180700 [Sesamum alatum]